MFLLLVIVCAMHQAYSTIHEKTDQWPLRIWLMRCIEFAGRTFVFPSVIIYYLTEMKDVPLTTKYTMLAVVLSMTFLIATREFLGVRKAFFVSLGGLLEKINAKDVKIDQLSKLEILIFNFWYFSRITTKLDLIAEYLHKVGDFDDPARHTLDLRNVYALRESAFGSQDVTTEGGANAAGEILLTTFKSKLQAIKNHTEISNPMTSGVDTAVVSSAGDAKTDKATSGGGVQPGSIKKVNQNRPKENSNSTNSNGKNNAQQRHHTHDESPRLSTSIRMSLDNVSDSDDEV